ncbi:MAG: hypothetical protein LBH34_03945, partial [Prevotellaceae bacterium]|nr:hypothetical protein [Prevotellaceae bacterium]
MRKLLCLVIFVTTSSLMSFAASRQNSDSLYRKPLKEVLEEIQKEFGVRLKYSDGMVEGRWLNYADWRKRPYSVEKSLANVLAPFDMKYVVEEAGIYKIKDYEYPRRVEEEGKEHLEYLSTLYNDLISWEKRKDSLKSCMIDALGLNPMPKKPNTKPILSKVRKYNGYSVQNFALEILDGVYVAGSVYRPLKSKGLQPVIINPNGHFGNGRYRKDQQLR